MTVKLDAAAVEAAADGKWRVWLHLASALAEDGELKGFAICGEDRRWHWADATIDQDTVVVASPDVPRLASVRYDWANNRTCYLYNGAGLRAAPFRTDNFPLTTANDTPAP